MGGLRPPGKWGIWVSRRICFPFFSHCPPVFRHFSATCTDWSYNFYGDLMMIPPPFFYPHFTPFPLIFPHFPSFPPIFPRRRRGLGDFGFGCLGALKTAPKNAAVLKEWRCISFLLCHRRLTRQGPLAPPRRRGVEARQSPRALSHPFEPAGSPGTPPAPETSQPRDVRPTGHSRSGTSWACERWALGTRRHATLTRKTALAPPFGAHPPPPVPSTNDLDPQRITQKTWHWTPEVLPPGCIRTADTRRSPPPPPPGPDFIVGENLQKKEIYKTGYRFRAIFGTQTFGFQTPPPFSLLIHPCPALTPQHSWNPLPPPKKVPRVCPEPGPPIPNASGHRAAL